ncbi:MAG: exodeoxyribonuclease III [Clostridiaceae bacterium]
MKIYSWNVNGLRAILGKNFIEFIEEEKPDILCAQETKIQESQITDEMRNLDGYYSYFSFAKKKGYSGVLVYSKIKPNKVYHGFGEDRYEEEGRILVLEYDDFTLLNIYFPNGQMNEDRLNFKMKFYDETLDFCNKLVEEGKKLVICGDYNTAHTENDIKNAKANEKNSGFLPMERQWIDKFIDNGYTDSYRFVNKDKIEYSWWSYRFKARERNTGWRIDYHFVSNNLLNQVLDAKILTNVIGSDHCPILLDLK